jgi:hypothetical protein
LQCARHGAFATAGCRSGGRLPVAGLGGFGGFTTPQKSSCLRVGLGGCCPPFRGEQPPPPICRQPTKITSIPTPAPPPCQSQSFRSCTWPLARLQSSMAGCAAPRSPRCEGQGPAPWPAGLPSTSLSPWQGGTVSTIHHRDDVRSRPGNGDTFSIVTKRR